MLADFFAVIGQDQKRNGTELILISLMEFGTKLLRKMMIEFSETAHPMFRASSALERGELRSKEGDEKTTHFNGGEQNIE